MICSVILSRADTAAITSSGAVRSRYAALRGQRMSRVDLAPMRQAQPIHHSIPALSALLPTNSQTESSISR